MNNYISLYIPAYNAEKSIEKSIKSVFQQTLKPKEIIVINDCSTDKTLNLIKNFHQIKIINNNKNYGLAKSRNIALEYSKYDYLASIDSDVVCEKDWLEILFKTMLEKIGPVLLQSETAAKISFDDKEKKYHALFSAVIMFEKDLGIYLEKFTSNFLSENKAIISQIRIIHNSNEIINHFRSTNLLRRNTKNTFEKNFIYHCIFGQLPSYNGTFKVKDSFKTHMKNCEELLEVLKVCYD